MDTDLTNPLAVPWEVVNFRFHNLNDYAVFLELLSEQEDAGIRDAIASLIGTKVMFFRLALSQDKQLPEILVLNTVEEIYDESGGDICVQVIPDAVTGGLSEPPVSSEVQVPPAKVPGDL